MSGRHRKPTTSAISVAKIAFTGAVIGGSGIALAGQAGAATDGEWDRVASRESGGNRAINTDDEEKEVRVGMLKRIATVLISAPLMLGFATAVANADVNDGGVGMGGATEDKVSGQPADPNGFGTANSQRATSVGDIGEHSSGFSPGQRKEDGESAEGRQGVGNVARTDNQLSTAMGQPNIGDAPGDHGNLVLLVPDDNDATNPACNPGNQKRANAC